MNESDDHRIQALLKSALPAADVELPRDLWPEMLKRIESGAGRRFTFSPLDWAIAGLTSASVLIFPGLIPGLLYHL